MGYRKKMDGPVSIFKAQIMSTAYKARGCLDKADL